MVGLGALAARARERKGGAAPNDKGKKRSASETSEVAAALRPRRSRGEVGQEGATVLIVSPLQERPPPERAAARLSTRRAHPSTSRGVPVPAALQWSAGQRVVPGMTEAPPGPMGVSGLSSSGEAGPEEAQGHPPESSFRPVGEPSGEPVLDSPEPCHQLLQELRQRFPQDIRRLEGLVLPSLVDQSYLHVIRGALISDQLCRSLAKAEGDRDTLRLRISELEAEEREGRTWEMRAKGAEGKIEEIEGRLRVANEAARVAEERRSLSDQRANAAEEQMLQAESKMKAMEERCQKVDEKSRELTKQAKQVESRMHLAETSLLARELELKDVRAQLGGLTAELENTRAELGRNEARAEDDRTKLGVAQFDVGKLQEEVGDLRSALGGAEERVAKAEAEALDSLTDAYLQGFGNCRRQVGGLFPDLDLSGLDEGDVGEEAGSRPPEDEGDTKKGVEGRPPGDEDEPIEEYRWDDERGEGEVAGSGRPSKSTAEPDPEVVVVSPPAVEIDPEVVE